MKKIRVSLAYKVVAAFLIIMLPIVTAFFYAYRNGKAVVERLILEELAADAESRQSEALLFIEMTRTRMEDFASDNFIVTETEKILSGAGDPAVLGEYIRKYKLPLVENFFRITVVARGGRVAASTLSSAVGKDYSHEEFFRKGRWRTSVTERVRGYMETGPEIVISTPIYSRKTRKPIGLIAGVFPFDRFTALFDGGVARRLGAKTRHIMEDYRTREIYLVNRDSLMLTESKFLKGSVLKQRVDTEPVKACLERGEAMTGFYYDYRGSRVAGASACFRDLGWTMLIEIDRQEALGPIASFRRYAGVTALVTAGLTGALVVFFLRVFVAQIRRLTGAAAEVASGNYGITIPVRTSDETGVLTESFNDMSREIKKSNETLRETKERLRAILDNTTQVVYLKDTNGRYILINREYEKLFGITKEDIYGKTDHDIFPTEYADAFKKNDLDVLDAGHPMEFEEQAIAAGVKHWYISVKFPLWNTSAKPYAVGGISTDITERTLAQEALQKSEARLTNAQRIAHIGSWEWDIETNEVYLSDEMLRLFGLKREEGPGYNAIITRIHPEDRDFVLGAIDDALYRCKPYSLDHRIIQPCLTERIIHVEAEVTYDEYGNPVKMAGTSQDITELKRAEAEVRKLNEELERRVMERTEQLAAANRELETFSYSAAHDLKTPLRLIDGFSSVLLRDYTGSLDERGRDYLGRVRSASVRMARLIEDLLDFSRVMRAEMKIEEADISAMAREIFENLKKNQPERDGVLVIKDRLAARCDENLLKIVMENLIDNAWKFTSGKERAKIEVGEAGKDVQGKTIFFVRDNGAGFDMKYAERLFAPFQRLHPSDEFPGTGVGLATVARIIQRHGGRVWAEAAPGKGATFYFTL